MRIKKLIYLSCVALLSGLASCSGKFPPPEEESIPKPVTISYLSVNLLSGGESGGAGGTRADNGTYVAGDPDENKVNSIRFYFFTAEGGAAYVKRTSEGAMVNYLEWPSDNVGLPGTVIPGGEGSNIEKIITAQLVINTAEGDELPFQIIAIINPPEDMPEIGSIDDADAINDIADDYSAGGGRGFVMSNSVYVDRAGGKMVAVPVLGHIFTEPDIALLNPVTIFVERVNAKTTMRCTLNAVGDNTYDTGVMINDRTDKGLTPGKIYVKFLGWDVTQAVDKSYLVKHIDETWSDADIFGASAGVSWNYPDGFRSFWAINPELVAPKKEGSNYRFKSFNDHTSAGKVFEEGEDKVNYLYLQENAAEDAGSGCSYPTQLIITAKLVDGQGSELTLADYGFFQYTVEGLKVAMADKAGIYKKREPVAEGTEFVKIDESDLVLVSAAEAGMASPDEEGRYWVYAAIKGTGTGSDEKPFDSQELTDYYIGSDEDAQPATYAAVNSRLASDCGHAKLWLNGNTYYYADIRHLGGIKAAAGSDGAAASKGAYGIVRNHIYALSINTLSGLGTPVYRPDEVIYPEKPADDETYIGAEVNVLEWRIVNQDVSFAW